MPYDIYVLDESDVTLTGAVLDGVTQGDGSHMVGATMVLSPDWYPVSINDNDADFSDNDSSQTLNGTQTVDGVSYGGGTRVEAEYSMVLSDGTNQWTVVAFNVNNSSPAFGTVEGLAFIGGPGGFPPAGVTLTVLSAAEGPSFAAADYATPICFAAGTLIDTPDGPRPIEDIAVGDLVDTLHDGPQPVRWQASRTWPARGKYAPVVFAPGTIGNTRALRLSQQHRVLVRGWRAELYFGSDAVLIPACRFVNGRDVCIAEGGMVQYHHLLFDRHQIVLSEGAETESFHPGAVGVTGLPDEARDELFDLIPQARGLEVFGVTAATVLRGPEVQVMLAA